MMETERMVQAFRLGKEDYLYLICICFCFFPAKILTKTTFFSSRRFTGNKDSTVTPCPGAGYIQNTPNVHLYEMDP